MDELQSTETLHVGISVETVRDVFDFRCESDFFKQQCIQKNFFFFFLTYADDVLYCFYHQA